MSSQFIINNGGMSGSLTRLVDGSSYLIAGQGIAVTSGSMGQIEISLNRSEVRECILPDADVSISSSMGTDFVLNPGTLTATHTASLMPAKLQNTCLTFLVE